jgi:hypothetical protein
MTPSKTSSEKKISDREKQGRVIFIEIISRKKKQQTTTISYYLSTKRKKSFLLNYEMNCQM